MLKKLDSFITGVSTCHFGFVLYLDHILIFIVDNDERSICKLRDSEGY
jgi:hypothetical protein